MAPYDEPNEMKDFSNFFGIGLIWQMRDRHEE
jgi:hypothetical protein